MTDQRQSHITAPSGHCHERKDGNARLAKNLLQQHLFVFYPGSLFMVGLGRVELPTSPLSGVRSNQLSYRPAPDALSSSFLYEPTGHYLRSFSVGLSKLNSSTV